MVTAKACGTSAPRRAASTVELKSSFGGAVAANAPLVELRVWKDQPRHDQSFVAIGRVLRHTAALR
jgi:hypothetical protein